MSMHAHRTRREDTDTGARVIVCGGVSEPPAILVRDLRKSYGDVDAVRGIDFDVARGEVFGLLGPNGAGKTTTVEILEGYRNRTSGIVSVLGHDPAGRPRALRERTGIVLQSSGMYRFLTVREAVAHWAVLYPRPRDVEEVIEVVGLQESADVRVRRLSGGQARRLDLALALVGDPELVFLDEPTTGFDPEAPPAERRQDEDVAEVGEDGAVAHHAGEAGLRAVGVVEAEGQRALDGAHDDLGRHPLRPVRLAQEAGDDGQVEPGPVGRDLEAVIQDPLHRVRRPGARPRGRRPPSGGR
jgi:ABC-2 type transport system ATP-binding protein